MKFPALRLESCKQALERAEARATRATTTLEEAVQNKDMADTDVVRLRKEVFDIELELASQIRQPPASEGGNCLQALNMGMKRVLDEMRAGGGIPTGIMERAHMQMGTLLADLEKLSVMMKQNEAAVMPVHVIATPNGAEIGHPHTRDTVAERASGDASGGPRPHAADAWSRVRHAPAADGRHRGQQDRGGAAIASPSLTEATLNSKHVIPQGLAGRCKGPKWVSRGRKVKQSRAEAPEHALDLLWWATASVATLYPEECRQAARAGDGLMVNGKHKDWNGNFMRRG